MSEFSNKEIEWIVKNPAEAKKIMNDALRDMMRAWDQVVKE